MRTSVPHEISSTVKRKSAKLVARIATDVPLKINALSVRIPSHLMEGAAVSAEPVSSRLETPVRTVYRSA
jgi:hypothetical protein